MSGYYADDSVTLLHGDALAELRTLPDGSVDCCVTSPPYYGLRDYGVGGQIGAEASPGQYVDRLVAVFAEVRRVLAPDGTCWVVLGDSYSSTGGHTDHGESSQLRGGRRIIAAQRGLTRPAAGLPPKSLIGIPWRVALALQADGWVLRADVIWRKPNAMPEPVRDRPRRTFEHVFILTKGPRYHYDRGAVCGVDLADDVWTVATQPFSGAHFAAMPPDLAEACALAGCRPGGVVLDPFSGSGTTGMVATKHGRRYVGIDLSEEYLALSLRTRLAQGVLTGGGAA